MEQSITFVDVETPNYQNNSISSIGVINVDGDGVVTTKYFLVDPEAHFDRFNIELTGITPEMVADQPNFKEVWSEIEPYFTNSLVVAHNAVFDLSVISACLQRYDLPIFPIFYTCTYRISRALKIPSNSYKLNDLSSYYHVTLDNHHNALADSKACMEIFYYLLKEPNLETLDQYVKCFEPTKGNKDNKKYLEVLIGLLTGIGFDNYLNKKEISFLNNWLTKNQLPYEYANIVKELKAVLKNEYITHYQYLHILNELQYMKSIKAKNIRSLYEFMAILEGISCDEVINDDEIMELNKWMKENEQFKGTYPFNRILNKLEKIIIDKQISTIVTDELLYYIKNFFKPELDQGDLFDVKNKVICLTGNFCFGERSQLEKLIVLKQGIISKSVTKKVDYLVLGSKGSAGYKYVKYGAKTNKALTMKSEGHKIELISEARLMEVLKLSK